MDELERAGRSLRDGVPAVNEPTERVRARARTIVRHRRMLAIAAVATAVIATSVGIGVAANGGSGTGIHTIAPAGSSTTHTLLTTHVVPTVPTTAPRQREDGAQSMPELTFADSLHGWRSDLMQDAAVDQTRDGGRTWTTQPRYATGDSVNGVVAVDDRHAFALITYCCDGSRSQLMRTTDGAHWQPASGAGLPAALVAAAFVDPTHGWGLTDYGDLVTTADAGDHWQTMRQPDTGRGADRMLVGSICPVTRRSGWSATAATVYRTDDDGATWRAQATIGRFGSTPKLVCNGTHAAFASFGVGAGQFIGAFLRTDDGGTHWRPLTENTNGGTVTVTAPGFPDMQERGAPFGMSADGTLLFVTGRYASEPTLNRVVTASPVDRFVIGHFDSTEAQQVVSLVATASDAAHEFVEVQRVARGSNGTGPRPVSLYASSDGGLTWQLRSTEP
jgi:photosystem II stability/assembly factor-like uncharacterized protein